MDIHGVIHAGAHLAEEAPIYAGMGIENVVWIEAEYRAFNKIIQNGLPPGQMVIHALVADEDGKEFVFNITNYDSMSSSVFEFGTHPNFSPDTKFISHIKLFASTLDRLVEVHNISGCNFLNMDLQGAELLALKGATKLLPELDYIYTEVNTEEVYVGCAKMNQLDEFLSDFSRVETFMTPNGWGDALYVRKELLTLV